jgi:uncharacterized membrane protein YvlD (DUF360 family)
MLNLALQFIYPNLVLLLTLKFVPGLELERPWVLIPAFFMLGLVNFLIRPILLALGQDITVRSLGLASFLINILLLNLTTGLLDDYDLKSWTGSIFGASILTFLQVYFDAFERDRENASR